MFLLVFFDKYRRALAGTLRKCALGKHGVRSVSSALAFFKCKILFVVIFFKLRSSMDICELLNIAEAVIWICLGLAILKCFMT
jgi:hypothetical protein